MRTELALRTNPPEKFVVKKPEQEDASERISNALGIEVQGHFDLLDAQVVELFSNTTPEKKIQLGSVFKIVPGSIHEDPESRFQKARRIISKLRNKLLRPNGFDIKYAQDEGIENSGYYLQRPEPIKPTEEIKEIKFIKIEFKPGNQPGRSAEVRSFDESKSKEPVTNQPNQLVYVSHTEQSAKPTSAESETQNRDGLFKEFGDVLSGRKQGMGKAEAMLARKEAQDFCLEYVRKNGATTDNLMEISRKTGLPVIRVIGSIKTAIFQKEITRLTQLKQRSSTKS